MSPFLTPSRRAELARVWQIADEVLRFAWRRAREERIGQVAGSLAFTTILSLVPLATIGFALLTALPVFSHLQDSLREILVQQLLPPTVSDSIFKNINHFATKARGLTVFGVVFLGATAVSTMLTVDRALNTIWRVREPRPLSQRVLVYWAVLTVGPILLAASVTLSSYVASASVGLVHKPPLGVRILIDLVPLVVVGIAYAALYVYVPNCPVEWKHALIGGALASVAFDIARRGFAVYITRFPTYTVIYGALAALPIFFIWVYMTWLITLSGAAIAASLPAFLGRRWNASDVPGRSFPDAVRLLRLLHGAREQALPGLLAQRLSTELHMNLEETEALLTALEGAGTVIRILPLGAAGGQRRRPLPLWLLAADERRVTLGDLFARLVYDGPRHAQIGFARGDPLRELVAATPRATLDLTLAEVFQMAH